MNIVCDLPLIWSCVEEARPVVSPNDCLAVYSSLVPALRTDALFCLLSENRNKIPTILVYHLRAGALGARLRLFSVSVPRAAGLRVLGRRHGREHSSVRVHPVP